MATYSDLRQLAYECYSSLQLTDATKKARDWDRYASSLTKPNGLAAPLPWQVITGNLWRLVDELGPE